MGSHQRVDVSPLLGPHVACGRQGICVSHRSAGHMYGIVRGQQEHMYGIVRQGSVGHMYGIVRQGSAGTHVWDSQKGGQCDTCMGLSEVSVTCMEYSDRGQCDTCIG